MQFCFTIGSLKIYGRSLKCFFVLFCPNINIKCNYKWLKSMLFVHF